MLAPVAGMPHEAPIRKRKGPLIALFIAVGVLALGALAWAAYVSIGGSLGDTGVSCPEGAESLSDSSGFALCAPSSWESQRNIMGTRLMMLSPLMGPDDDFRENVNVVQLRRVGDDIHKAAEGQRDEIRQFATDYQEVSATFGTLGGAPAHTLVYKYRQGTYELYGEQTFVLQGGKGFAMTYTAQLGHEEEARREVSAIWASFTFS